jgi:hypothetical protein
MNRREFALALPTLAIARCCCQAKAELADHGCRAASAQPTSLQNTLRSSSGNHEIDTQVTGLVRQMNEQFGVSSGFSFYADGTPGNAEATTAQLFTQGPDGTVLLGTSLVDALMKDDANNDEKIAPSFREYEDLLTEVKKRLDERKKLANEITFAAAMGYLRIFLIVAHEFAHIRQFKSGMNPTGPWQMEPHADFMAGWALAHNWGATESHPYPQETEIAALTMFKLGDLAFNDPDHHGQPELRAAMVRSGLESNELNLQAAFDKGLKWAGVAKEFWPPAAPN